jgi:hypothetical protein
VFTSWTWMLHTTITRYIATTSSISNRPKILLQQLLGLISQLLPVLIIIIYFILLLFQLLLHSIIVKLCFYLLLLYKGLYNSTIIYSAHSWSCRKFQYLLLGLLISLWWWNRLINVYNIIGIVGRWLSQRWLLGKQPIQLILLVSRFTNRYIISLNITV